MIASKFASLCLLVTSVLAYPAAVRMGDRDAVQNFERSEPIYYYTYLPALQRRDLETQEYTARDLEMLKKYVDSLGLEKRGLFKSLTFKMPKIGTSPTMSNSLPAPKPKVLAPPPKVEAPAPAIPAPKIEAPKPPTPPAPAPKVEAPSSIVPAPKVEPPAPVVPAPKVEAPKPPAPASPPPPPPPPVNNPPPNAPPAAAPPAQAPAEAPQSGGWAQKIQGGAETLNAGMGLTSSVMDLVTADKNYATVKVQAEQASQASESSSSAQPAPTA
ncbi:hypothetical protein PC9H_005723 [Pleurotus ostreatus]|uniref:Uncharacterized protein n=1 Tax=Pleurotus ostreatus TaxID=5322 RepID=A0A8H7A159_PLEOS|nr:uncharacterized protein PC9H_005723 [Pleurotus ostreatus]KAF7433758.1 hypothetical protein PC9H_005723 [Pleurotus ostreatus]KAJ8697458.1 hypothetical protein PTI98_004262 [Pleurotus ostreatus]